MVDLIETQQVSGAGNDWRNGGGKKPAPARAKRRAIRILSASSIDAAFVLIIWTLAFALMAVSFAATYVTLAGGTRWNAIAFGSMWGWQTVAFILQFGGLNRARQGERSGLIAWALGLGMSAIPTGLQLTALFAAQFAEWGVLGYVIVWAAAIGADVLPELLLVERGAK